MKNKLKFIGLMGLMGLMGACASLTPQEQAAINVGVPVLLATAQTFAGIYGSKMNPQQQATLSAGLNAAGKIYQGYVGQQIPTTVIDTGVPAVSAALVAHTNPTGNVTQANVDTLYQAAAAVAVAPTSPNVPTASGGQ